MKRLLVLLFLLLPALGLARELGDLEFTNCTLRSSATPKPVDALCATLAVPEDRSRADGRSIELAIAWLAPEAGEAEPDPVFLLAGGPGQSARESFPALAAAFNDLAKRRNIILLDQRGTGDSNRLACAEPEGIEVEQTLETVLAYTRECMETLSEKADLRHYTTTEAVADLDAVRRAIGAEQINLVGISYGTRVAQQYMKAHPDAVRALVLDGVVPNSLVLGQEHARNLEDTLGMVFHLCDNTPACVDALGRPRQHFEQLAAELRETPRQVRYRDATSAAMRDGEFGYPMLAALLRMYAYQPMIASSIPLLLHELAEGETDSAMAQANMLMESLGDSMAHGMGLSVSCSEDADELEPDPADADTVLGAEFVEYMQEQCAIWPHGQRPADFREPARGDTPVLLLSGELDPVTPPRYGAEVAGHLQRARHLVLRGQGHNVIGAGCMPKLVARFVESADPDAPEAACLDRLITPPPFTGHHGWEP